MKSIAWSVFTLGMICGFLGSAFAQDQTSIDGRYQLLEQHCQTGHKIDTSFISGAANIEFKNGVETVEFSISSSEKSCKLMEENTFTLAASTLTAAEGTLTSDCFPGQSEKVSQDPAQISLSSDRSVLTLTAPSLNEHDTCPMNDSLVTNLKRISIE